MCQDDTTLSTGAAGDRVPPSSPWAVRLLQVGILLAAVAGGALSAWPAAVRLLLAGALVAWAAALALLTPPLLLRGLFVWLLVLALVRRLIAELVGPVGIDPLIAVGPAGAGFLVIVAWRRGAFRDLSAMAKGVAVLSALVLLAALNPNQGSLKAGVSSLVYVLVPLLGFWVGRRLGDDDLTSVLRTVGIGAVLVAAYGLWQTFVGFPPWDRHWIEQSSVVTLFVGGARGVGIRPFSTLSSPAEHAYLVAIGIGVWLTLRFRRPFRALDGAALMVLVVALAMSSVRSVAVAGAVGAGVAVWGRWRVPLVAAVVAAMVLIVGASLGLSRLTDVTSGGAGALAGLQAGGLTRPFDPSSSSLAAHVDMAREGLRTGFTHPLGLGLSAVTTAGAKFGTEVRTTDIDPSNAAVAMGLPGLIAYIGVAALALRLLWRLIRARRDPLAVLVVAVTVTLALEWLNGNQYAVALLPWLALGWADTAVTGDPSAIDGSLRLWESGDGSVGGA